MSILLILFTQSIMLEVLYCSKCVFAGIHVWFERNVSFKVTLWLVMWRSQILRALIGHMVREGKAGILMILTDSTVGFSSI